MSGFWLVAIVAFMAWVLHVNSQNRDVANKNAEIANQNLIATNHNAVLATIYRDVLIKQLGPKKAAAVYLDALLNTGLNGADKILGLLCERAGLINAAVPNAKKILLRDLESSFQTVADQMDDEIDHS